MMPDVPTPDIGRALDAVVEMLRDRRRLLESGRLVDLGGLEARVEAICRELALLPPEQARGFVPLLSAVADELAALDSECRRRLSQRDIDRAGSRRAAMAYTKPKPDGR